MSKGSTLMVEKNPERVVVVTSLPDGVVPLTPGERSMIEQEPAQTEQAFLVDHSYPPLRPDTPGRRLSDQIKDHFLLSEAEETISRARALQEMHPAYLPAHVYEELGLNISADRDLGACVRRCHQTLELARSIVNGSFTGSEAPTERPVKPEQIIELMDSVRYNLADRYMRLGRLPEALEQLRLSQALPKTVEQRVKRALKEASLLYSMGDLAGHERTLRIAKSYGSDMFGVLRERLALDGHAGLGSGVEK